MKWILEVQNMKCDGCVKAVSDALDAMGGVNSYNVNLDMATVEVEGEFAIDAVLKTLVSAGYPAKVM